MFYVSFSYGILIYLFICKFIIHLESKSFTVNSIYCAPAVQAIGALGPNKLLQNYHNCLTGFDAGRRALFIAQICSLALAR